MGVASQKFETFSRQKSNEPDAVRVSNFSESTSESNGNNVTLRPLFVSSHCLFFGFWFVLDEFSENENTLGVSISF